MSTHSCALRSYPEHVCLRAIRKSLCQILSRYFILSPSLTGATDYLQGVSSCVILHPITVTRRGYWLLAGCIRVCYAPSYHRHASGLLVTCRVYPLSHTSPLPRSWVASPDTTPHPRSWVASPDDKESNRQGVLFTSRVSSPQCPGL